MFQSIYRKFVSFQKRTKKWTLYCFGPKITFDKIERIHRFVEESLELAQSVDCPKEEILKIVDYVYSRPKGDIKQEVGGVANTLVAFCNAHDIDFNEVAEKELDRCWSKSSIIREKQKLKPRFEINAV